MLTGCTFRRMPSRVPFSMCSSQVRMKPDTTYVVSAFRRTVVLGGPLSPTENPLERKEIRLHPVQPRQQPRAILLDEALEEIGREVTRVFGEQRPLHPFDHRLARRQDMRIDH